MPRDFNINIAVGGGDRRGAYGGGNVYKTRNTLNSRGVSENGNSITSSNLSRVFSIGLAFNKMQQGNELLGAYTENRLRQKKFNVAMTFAKYSIGLGINPLAGGVYAVGDMAYRGISYGIEIQKKNKEAMYFRRISGNNANSGRRYRGDYL
jgi:hypothetical protein